MLVRPAFKRQVRTDRIATQKNRATQKDLQALVPPRSLECSELTDQTKPRKMALVAPRTRLAVAPPKRTAKPQT